MMRSDGFLAVIKKNAKFLIAAFFTLIFWVICKTFQDYGITWDEQYHQIYGNLIIEWYLSFFKDAAAVYHFFLVFYGGFFDALVQLLSYASPWDNIESRHFLGGIFGLWAVLMSYKIAQNISGVFAGFCAALFLIFHPVFYGHMFNSPVDIPFAALLLTTLYFMIASSDHLPKVPSKYLFGIGIAAGLALAIRIGGLLIIVPAFVVYRLLWLGSHWPQNKDHLGPFLLNLAQNLVCILAIAWPIMLLWWPRAQVDPFLYPFKALYQTAHWNFNPEKLYIFFQGTYYKISDVPKSYLIKSILLSLPEFYFITLGLGTALAIYLMMKNLTQTGKRFKIIFLLFVLAYPVLAALVFNTPRFDGFRHFLFLIPILAVLAGISFAEFVRSKAYKIFKIASILGIVFSVALTAFDMYRLHPYQTVYFNRLLAGGLEKAAKNYETDYWGNSYREGILWLMNNYHPLIDRKIRILSFSWPFQTRYYLEKSREAMNRFEMVEDNPDIFISTTRRNCHKAYREKIIYTVERDHAPLLYVIEVPKNTPMTTVETCP